MNENLTGLIKIVGISILLVTLWIILSVYVPEKFLSPNNIENLLRRTALYGILGVGVAFVIMTSGIDLSLGSLVCLCGCLLAIFLRVEYQPINQADVWAISAENRTLLVPSETSLESGQSLRLFNARKARNLLARIESVRTTEFNGRPAKELTLDQKPSRDDALDGSLTAIGKVVPVYPLESIETPASDDSGNARPSELTIAAGALGLQPRDRLVLVSSKGGIQEKTIASVRSNEQQTEIQLKDSASEVDDQWQAIPVKRVQRMSVQSAVGLVLLIAAGLGLLHGLLITRLGQQPFVVTLCGLLIYRGLSRRLSNDQVLGFGDEYADSLNALATGRWVLWEAADGSGSFGIPYVFFILLGVALLAAIFLNLTIWGRYILALGKNQEAARYSGINTGRMICLTYLLCGLITGLGGILHAIDANSISPSSFGNWFELWAIAAAVLGGCSLRGGEGGIIGVIVGTALMQTLYNMIVLLKIPSELEYVIIGAVILIGVVSDELIRRAATAVRTR
ncbi:MAG: ABC transporter permease [Planctomycetota bacterium]